MEKTSKFLRVVIQIVTLVSLIASLFLCYLSVAGQTPAIEVTREESIVNVMLTFTIPIQADP